MSEKILFEIKDKTAIVTLNRPKANQLDNEMADALVEAFIRIESDTEIRCVIITGAGEKIFCAGADLSAGFGGMSAVDYLKKWQDMCNKIAASPVPVIAALNGHATGGGCEIAMSCHLRIMEEDATIGLTETNLGIIPGFTGTLRLPRLTGYTRAMEYLLMGKRITAEEALSTGLINRICPAGKALESSIETARELAERPPLAVRSILKIMEYSHNASPEQHLKLEREELAALFRTKDCVEGMNAFAEKRKPVFRGE